MVDTVEQLEQLTKTRDRKKGLPISQARIARELGATTLTVNRWFLGKQKIGLAYQKHAKQFIQRVKEGKLDES